MTDHFDTRKLQVSCLENAIVVPGGPHGGGIVHNGHYLNESMVHRGWRRNECLEIPNGISCRHEAAIFLGEFRSCWGHCLTDGLKFAWAFLPTELHSWKNEDVRLVYVTSGPGEILYDNFVRMWELLGIKREQMIRIDVPTCFDRLYLPEESYYLDVERGERFYTSEYLKTIDYIRGCVVPKPSPPTRDIFFTRTQWKTSKRDFGERQLVDAISKATHCECISPEQLSLDELIRTLSDCRRLIATEGSIAHNAVFLQNGVKLLVLEKADYENGYQPPIDQMRKLVCTRVKAHSSMFPIFPDSPWQGEFFLHVTPALAKCLGINPQFPKIEFLRYCLYSWKTKACNFVSIYFMRPLRRFLHRLFK